ncbi:hypothetical protein BDZ89DRAFT_658028 [Hymenopellis radicata]|nr:hypothetical protein BDZ89DRAFT_658028 [Hymenopellis radicata]
MTSPIDTSVPPSDRLGQSEYVPSQIERAAIQAFIPSAKSALEELELELQALQRRRDEAASILANAESALSPIRVLPIEMLQEIFFWACAGETHKLVLPASSYEKPETCLQWCLMRVCRRWRAAVTTQPRLWNTIAVGCHDWISGRDFEIEEEDDMESRSYTASEVDRAIDYMSTVLRYSSQAALNMTIEFTVFDTLPDPKSQSVNRLLAFLFASSPRWRTASLTMAGEYPVAPLTTLRHNLPRLENLSVSLDPVVSYPLDLDGTEARLAIENIFSDTPRLKNITFYDSFANLNLPWEQIKFFRGAMCVSSYDGFFHSLLRQCTNLERFHAPVFCRDPNASNPSAIVPDMSPLVQTSLKDIYLAQAEYTDLLTLPKITNLTIAFGQEIGEQDSDGIEEQCAAVKSLLARSECMPSRLTISQYFRDFIDSSMQDLLADEHFANLATLCVLGVPPHHSNLNDPDEDVHDIFESLAELHAGKLVLPKLEVLEINFMTSFDGFDLETVTPPNIGPLSAFNSLEKMIRARAGHLREIRLLFNMPRRTERFPWTYDICDAISEEMKEDLPSVLRSLRQFKGSVKIELTMKYSFRRRLPHRTVVIDLTSVPVPKLLVRDLVPYIATKYI